MIDDFGAMTKNNCHSRIVFDMDFCVRVCDLPEGEKCSSNPGIGDDLCSIGTKCSPESGTCESLPMVSDFQFQGDYDSLNMSHTRKKLTVVYHMMC